MQQLIWMEIVTELTFKYNHELVAFLSKLIQGLNNF